MTTASLTRTVPVISDGESLASATIGGKLLQVYDDGYGQLFAVWDNCGYHCYIIGLIRAQSWEDAWSIAEDEFFPDPDETHEDWIKEYGENYTENGAWQENFGFRNNSSHKWKTCFYQKSLDIPQLQSLTAANCAEAEIVLTIETED